VIAGYIGIINFKSIGKRMRIVCVCVCVCVCARARARALTHAYIKYNIKNETGTRAE
jgi:hypothetical protein